MRAYHCLIHWSNPLRPKSSLGSNWILYLLVFILITHKIKRVCANTSLPGIFQTAESDGADMAKTGHQLKTNSHYLGHKTNKEDFFKYTLYKNSHTNILYT